MIKDQRPGQIGSVREQRSPDLGWIVFHGHFHCR
jgi:hypothetical protein